MRARAVNRTVQAVMAGALIVTGLPLVRPVFFPEKLQPVAAAAMEPGVIAVDAKDKLSAKDIQDLNARYGISLRLNSVHAEEEKLFVADVPAGQEDALVAALDKDPRIEEAERMHLYAFPKDEAAAVPVARREDGKAQGWTPNDPRFKEQWNLKLIGAEEAWGKKATGKGVVVAVIDTGVAAESDERCYRAKDFGTTGFVKGFDFVNKDEHPNDDHGHGTHVAGTIAESTNNKEGVAGLAFDAKIMPLKVLDGWGSGRTSDIADAIRYAADHGAQIINMSLGGPFPDPIMRLACEYAKKKGVLIVAAAGNSSGGPVGYPAAFPECLAVSSVGPKGELAYYSSIGKQVGIAGPGGDKSLGEEFGVLQNTVLDNAGAAGDDYYSFQGTSMASPHVAAAAALVMGRGVKDPDQVRQILQKSATPKKPANKYGAGILNAAKSVSMADNARRDSLLFMLFSAVTGALTVTAGAVRSKIGGLKAFPFPSLGLALGLLGPDMLFGWLGFGSNWNILFHSALIPLFLLSEAESKGVYRFVAAMACGMALHLGFDAFREAAPFTGVLPVHATPWMWVNTVVALGVAVVAYRRSYMVD